MEQKPETSRSSSQMRSVQGDQCGQIKDVGNIVAKANMSVESEQELLTAAKRLDTVSNKNVKA